MDYKARFYSPKLGRFIQPDTIVPGAGNPQNFNRYSYVNNNPINFIDPTGHSSHEACFYGGECDLPSDQIDEACVYAGRCGGGGQPTSSSTPTTISSGQEPNGPVQSWGPDWKAAVNAGYTPWELRALNTIYYNGGSEGRHSVNYILDNGVRIFVSTGGEFGDGKDVAGWYYKNYGGARFFFENPHNPGGLAIVLNSNKSSYGTLPSFWRLGTIIHEADHLERGGQLTEQKELFGAQVGIKVAINLGFYSSGAPGTLPGPGNYDWHNDVLALDANKSEDVDAYKELLEIHDNKYWWGFRLLPND